MGSGRTVLAEYFVGDEDTVVFFVRSDLSRPQVSTIDIGRDGLRAIVDYVFPPAEGGLNRIGSAEPADVQQLLGPLVAPIRDWAEEDDVVWIVPHDVLHYLPLHAAELEGRPLADRNPVCYSPSGSVMKYCRERRTARRRRALIMGDPEGNLRHSRSEAVALAEQFGTVPLCGPLATKAALLERLTPGEAGMDVIHFACHGYFAAGDPLQSGIRLAPAPGSAPGSPDSRLTAEEMYGLGLHADLVTVSACESGLVERRSGDELIGLIRAILFAGTASALVSLWKVDSRSTTLLMRDFYSSLLGDEPIGKAQALRLAQRFVRELTAKAIVDECNRDLAAIGADSEGRMSLLRDRADAEYIARDYAAAVATQELARHLVAGEGRKEVDVDIAATRFKAQHDRRPVDWSVKPFASAYYWAPFMLVGDWS
jgi:CHAT domain-containing protein